MATKTRNHKGCMREGGESTMNQSTYIVESGPNWRVTVRAPNDTAAIIKALRRDKPNALGILIYVSPKGAQGKWWDTSVALRAAGAIL